MGGGKRKTFNRNKFGGGIVYATPTKQPVILKSTIVQQQLNNNNNKRTLKDRFYRDFCDVLKVNYKNIDYYFFYNYRYGENANIIESARRGLHIKHYYLRYGITYNYRNTSLKFFEKVAHAMGLTIESDLYQDADFEINLDEYNGFVIGIVNNNLLNSPEYNYYDITPDKYIIPFTTVDEILTKNEHNSVGLKFEHGRSDGTERYSTREQIISSLHKLFS